MQTTIRTAVTLLLVWSISISQSLLAQVTVNFSASQTTGCGLVQTNFTDLSTTTSGIINDWTWDFDGSQSTLQNPGKTFSIPGTYTICLTVTTTTGATGTECKTDFIEVQALPQPEFSVDQQAGCLPLDVTFTDMTTSSVGISEYIWGVGGEAGVILDDGSLPSIENTYPTADFYTISLTVIDNNGCSNSISKPGFIEVLDNPEIQISASDTFSCVAPLAVDFTNDNIEANTNYTWDFGNGQTFSGNTPATINYDISGSYTVTVEAINTDAGCTSTLELPNLVDVGNPILISTDVQSACLGDSIQFFDDSADNADSRLWDFGDGTSSRAKRPYHAYQATGCYTVSLTREINGCSSTEVLSYCVEIFDLPNGSFTIDNPVGCSFPQEVNFSATVPPGFSVTWDFGDGNTGTGLNPAHTYTALGTYAVVPTITNGSGCSVDLPSQDVRLRATRARITFDDIRGCSPVSFRLVENSVSVAPITDWLWEVINPGAVPPVIFTSTDENPFVTLPDTGVFDIQLTVTNSFGCSDTKRFERKIYSGIKPNSDFTFLPDSACRNQDVSFIDNSSLFADEWIWDFGDGEIGYEQNPSHTYNTVGMYTVSLISLNNGCSDTLELVDALEILEPDAKMRAELFCDDLNLRSFINVSSGADIVHWDFGVLDSEADTASADTVSFNYPGPGTYTSTLVVESLTTGCTDTVTRKVVVTNLAAEIQIADSVGCAPFNLQIVNTTEDAVSYSWIAPGASIDDPDGENPGITYTSGGVYSNVELEVVDRNGCVENLVLNTPVQVSELVPDLAPSTLQGCAGTPIDFTNQSTSTHNSIVYSEWIIGNNLDTVESFDLSFTFDEAGDYPISLLVRDDGGCENSIDYADLINITDPQPEFRSDQYSCTFAPLEFVGEGEGEQMNYSWNFGDGSVATGDNPSHQYAAEGQYQVCVSVVDKNGCVADTCAAENIIVLNPVAGFSVDNNYGACPPLLTTFVNNSNNAVNYAWDFGDNSGESNLETPPHVYTDPGTYDVSLVAYTSELCTDTLVVPDFINLEGPIGDFTFNVEDDCAPGAVTFVANAQDDYDLYWDYGDGNIDTTLNVAYDSLVYNYEEIGTFKPKLILVDNVSCQRVIELPDSITMGGFNYDFSTPDTLYCGTDPLTASFIMDGQTSSPLQQISWSFPGSQNPSSSIAAPQVTYDAPGSYDVELILDNGSCRDTILKPNYIKVGALPDAQIALDVTNGCAPLSVNISDNSNINFGTISEWDWSFENQGTSSNQNNTIVFDTPGMNRISVEVTSDLGCTATSETEVEVFAQPEAEIMGETNICVGEEAMLSANVLSGEPGGSLLWTGGPIVGCDDCDETTVNPAATTVYTLVVTDGNGCTNESDYQVYVRSAVAPIIDLGTDTSICIESSIILDLQIDQPNTTIEWNTQAAGLSCYLNCPGPDAHPTEPTTYDVVVTSVDGCRSTESIFIDIIDDRQDFLGADQTICVGSEVQLSATYGTDPTWTANAALSCLDCPDPMASPEQESRFYLEVLSDNGCLITDSVLVMVQEPMEIEAGPTQMACVGVGTTMQGTGIGIPTWFPTEGVAEINNLNTAVTPEVTTMYYLSLDDGICIAEDSVLVEIIETAEIFTDGGAVCAGETFITEADGIADEITWHNMSGPIQQGEVFEIVPTATEDYYVVGELEGCAPDTAYFEIDVNENPVVEYPKSVAVLPGFSQQINPKAGLLENLEFTWTPAIGLSCASCPDPIAAPEQTTMYKVDIFNPATGCTITEEVEVRLRSKCGPDLMYVPNVFSPNGDGRNDEFKIEYSTIETIKSFRIYDRWGQVTFETDDIYEGWNGVSKGKKVNSGVYVYMIEAVCPIDGSTFYKKGDLTVLR